MPKSCERVWAEVGMTSPFKEANGPQVWLSLPPLRSSKHTDPLTTKLVSSRFLILMVQYQIQVISKS